MSESTIGASKSSRGDQYQMSNNVRKSGHGIPQTPNDMSITHEQADNKLSASEDTLPVKVGLRDRIHHVTWAWYTSVMATGGVALVLNLTPHKFSGLTVIGEIFYVLHLVMFILISAAIGTRFYLFANTLKSSLRHPTESLFFPCCAISFAITLSNAHAWGTPKVGDWLNVALCICFWILAAFALLIAILQYDLLFSGQSLTLQSMTPAWFLPIFPCLLTGVVASSIATTQPPEQALPILVCGLAWQGIGVSVSCFMFANYIGRLMSAGYPPPNVRPAMFIAVGPPAFTGLSLIGMAKETNVVFSGYSNLPGLSLGFPELLADLFKVGALVIAIFFWILAFWIFAISLVAVLKGARVMSFHLAWWSFIFPNVGLTISLIDIGQALGSEGVLWVSSIMSILLVAGWLFVMGSCIRAVWLGQICWPGKDEDMDQ
jgi:C4-dicarboxylate transporter/malic acid transport protein